MLTRLTHYITILFILLLTHSVQANVVATLTSGDVSVQVIESEGDYKLSFIYRETPIPGINPDAPVYLEVAGKELSGKYNSYELSDNTLTCKATIASGRGTKFIVNDLYIAKGSGIIELQRDLEIKEPQSGDRYFNSLFGFRTDENGTRLGKNDYFIPAVWYKSNFTTNGNLPSHLPQPDDTYFYYRDDRITLPVVMFRTPSTGFTLSIIHKDSPNETVMNDSRGIYIDEGYQFGAVGVKREDNIIYTNFIYPGSEADRATGKGLRAHPVQEGVKHAYKLELCFSTTSDYATAVKESWNRAFDLYDPAIYPVDLTATYNGIIETLMTYYGANTAMGGIYDAPGWPFQVSLENFHPMGHYNYQMGFVGMQLPSGYYIYREGIETSDEDMASKGEAVLDFWAANALTELGLPRDWYDPGTNGNKGSFRDGSNLRVNTGGMEGLIAAWAFARRNNIEKPEWISACKKYGDWLVENQNSDGSYYFSYNHRTVSNGKHAPINQNKFLTICAVRYLVELHIATEDERYKDTALKAGEYCYKNIHTNYTYVSCVIDNPQTIDSESGQMAMNGFLSLYDLTRDKKWLTAAEQAATYTESWTYCMEVPIESDKGDRSTLFPRDRSIVGQHIIAIGHSGADLGFAWSSFVFYRLYMETGNEHYLKVARISAHNSKQSMNWDGTLFPGQPKGLQMEVFNVNINDANQPRREAGVFTCLNWNYAAHLDPMFRFKDAFGTPDLEEVEKIDKAERKRLNYYYSQVQSANWGQEVEEYNTIETVSSPLSFKLFPNPVTKNGKLNIELSEDEDQYHINIYDLTGRVCLSERVICADSKFEIDLNGIATGQYIIRLEGAKENYASKLVVR